MSRGAAAGSPLRCGKFICTLLPVISRGRGIAGGVTGHGVFLLRREKTRKWKSSFLSDPSSIVIISLATRALLSLHPDLATL
jgi:hypothetical protein